MGKRLSKIYTRTGDDGSTGLGDGTRVAKDDARIEAYGSVDELNSSIGMLLACDSLGEVIQQQLTIIQHDLFDLGGELSVPGYEIVSAEYTTRLEQWLDEHNAQLAPLENFILPSGSMAASICHVARAICRRAERRIHTLSQLTDINPHALTYVNRLSDYLFVLARTLLRQAGIAEVLWNRPKPDAQ